MTARENPYPANAVAVYGTELSPTVQFAYMRRVRKLLENYITTYPDTFCALALSGGHGSGKTHLLGWLSDQIAQIKKRSAKVVYVKTNDPNPVNLYHQVLGNWTRDELLDVQRQGLIALGSQAAGAVRATVAVGQSIRDFDALKRAVQDKVLDFNALHISLRDELVGKTTKSSADTSRRIAAAIGLLDDTTFGEMAFNWLRGEAVTGLPNEALQGGLFGSEAEAGDTAIFALEAFAVLFRLADRPLIILIDQIENFLTDAKVARKSSNLKKLVEQLGTRGVALVMAGTPAGWERMPRDVGPRLTNRKPLIVGALTRAECRNLLELPLTVRLSSDAKFSLKAIAAIKELSSGNAREILRIAHQAFDATDGKIHEFTRDVLVQAAASTGTLEDRRQLARQMIEQASHEEGLILAAGSGRIDYQIRGAEGAQLSIIMVVATDATAESGLAREVADILRSTQDPAGAFLVVAIGYSSERVRKLLQVVVDIVTFDEMTLKSSLRERFAPFKLAQPAAEARPDVSGLESRLAQLDQVLAEVQQARADADRRIAEMLEARTVAAAEPERQAAEARTRYELRDGLDDLGEALADRGPQWERRIIRRLLVSNEINVKDDVFDYLGSMYLEGLDLERTHVSAGWELAPDASAREKALANLRLLRGNIVTTMRRILTRQGTPSHSPRYARATVAATVAVTSAIVAYLLITYVNYARAMAVYAREMSYPRGMRQAPYDVMPEPSYFGTISSSIVIFGVIFGILVGLATFFVLHVMSRPSVKYWRLRSQLAAIRRVLERPLGPA